MLEHLDKLRWQGLDTGFVRVVLDYSCYIRLRQSLYVTEMVPEVLNKFGKIGFVHGCELYVFADSEVFSEAEKLSEQEVELTGKSIILMLHSQPGNFQQLATMLEEV